MNYGPAECLVTLSKVWDGVASGDEQASLDFFFLALLESRGTDGIADLLDGYPQDTFEAIEKSGSGPGVLFTISRPGRPPLLIDAFAEDDLAFINVTVEPPTVPVPEADPRHVAFYTIWERLIEQGAYVPVRVGEGEEAVFLIATLEAEVMNGGLGQYLTNTDGVHVVDTLECLERIGATQTRLILMAAAQLGAKAESYVAAWEDESETLSRLDDQFMDTGEDLAALTAMEFLGE